MANFVADLKWSDVPRSVRERVQLTFRDVLGTTLGGAATTSARIASAMAIAEGQAEPAMVFTGQSRSSKTMAAFANGVAASALDFDDGHYQGSVIHPGAAIVPALLSACAQRDVGSHDFYCAQLAAYEVAIRVSYLLGLEQRFGELPSTIHATGLSATVGAAAGVARLLGLNRDGIRRAMEIGWAYAPNSGFQLPMTKESIGWGAGTAVTAGILAEKGFNEARGFAYPGLLFDVSPASEDPFVTSIGTTFEAANTYFKPHAACRYTHAAVDALQELMMKHELSVGDIVGVRVYTTKRASRLTEREPVTLEEAQYSFPFVLGAVAEYGAAGPSEIAEDRLEDARTLSFARRVSIVHDPNLDDFYPARYPCRVELDMASGLHLSLQNLCAKGDPERPMTALDLRNKFLSLAMPSLGRTAALEVADYCERRESVPLASILGTMSDALQQV